MRGASDPPPPEVHTPQGAGDGLQILPQRGRRRRPSLPCGSTVFGPLVLPSDASRHRPPPLVSAIHSVFPLPSSPCRGTECKEASAAVKQTSPMRMDPGGGFVRMTRGVNPNGFRTVPTMLSQCRGAMQTCSTETRGGGVHLANLTVTDGKKKRNTVRTFILVCCVE